MTEAPLNILELVAHVAVLHLEPDDVLVLTTREPLTVEQAFQLQEACRRALPGHECLVLTNGLELDAVRFER